jgi:hypothetical protein
MSVKQLKLTDRIRIIETESLRPSITSNITSDTLMLLSSKLEELKYASAQNPVTIQSIRAVLSRFSHPTHYDKGLLERSLNGALLFYKRACNSVKIAPDPYRMVTEHSEDDAPRVLCDYLYLIQTPEDSALRVGLYTLLNHAVKRHFVDNKLLRIEYNKYAASSKARPKQFGPRLASQGKYLKQHHVIDGNRNF